MIRVEIHADRNELYVFNDKGRLVANVLQTGEDVSIILYTEYRESDSVLLTMNQIKIIQDNWNFMQEKRKEMGY